MSIEDLMKPRYKVIADYPKSSFEIGQILLQDMDTVGEVFVLQSEVGKRFNSNWIDKKDVGNYPHLFKKLEWWEERGEIPEYLIFKKSKQIFKPSMVQLDLGWFYFTDDDYINHDNHYLTDTLPATEQDYNNYINKTK